MNTFKVLFCTVMRTMTVCANCLPLCSCDCSLCGFSAASAAAAEDGGDAAAEEEGDHGRQGDPEPQLQCIAYIDTIYLDTRWIYLMLYSYVESANSIQVVADVAELNMFQALSVSHTKLLVLKEYIFFHFFMDGK